MRLARTLIGNWRQLLRSPIFLGFLFLVVGFIVVAAFVDTPQLVVVANSVRTVLSLAVAAAFFPAALVYILEGRPMKQGYLVIGIFGSWAVEAAIGGIVVLRQLVGQVWWLSSAIVAGFVVLSSAFALMHLTARSIEDGERAVPRESWLSAALWIGLGMALGIAGAFSLKYGLLAGDPLRIG